MVRQFYSLAASLYVLLFTDGEALESECDATDSPLYVYTPAISVCWAHFYSAGTHNKSYYVTYCTSDQI